MKEILHIQSISQFHSLLGLPAPEHPLVSFINEHDAMSMEGMDDALFNVRFTSDMYTVMFKDKVSGSLGYGRSSYDFQEGTLIFGSPGQVFTSPKKEELNGKMGWTLLFHPDLLLKSPLNNRMDSFTYFSYEVNEALHMSDKEAKIVLQVVEQIKTEYAQNIDQHSQNLIVSNLELFLSYCMRFYDRQFYTRTNMNSDLVGQFEQLLKSYFTLELHLTNGIPSLSYFGSEMNMSPHYLSDLLKKETGRGIKEHIDNYLIRSAKGMLLGSNNSISQIAYDLGFEYPQSFSRLFKKKVGQSPGDYRKLN